MTRASTSRQLRRFTLTLSYPCIEAMRIIAQEHQPGVPLTKHMAMGILNDAVLLWGEMIKQKREQRKEQEVPLEDDPGTTGSDQQVTARDTNSEERSSNSVDGAPDADSGGVVPKATGTGDTNEVNAGE